MHVLITLVGKGYAPECMRISTHVYNNNGRDYRIAISGIAVGDKQKILWTWKWQSLALWSGQVVEIGQTWVYTGFLFCFPWDNGLTRSYMARAINYVTTYVATYVPSCIRK